MAQADNGPDAGQGGIVNMGLTCYANAVLQAMRSIKRVAWLLTEGRYNTLFSKEPKPKQAKQQDVTRAAAKVIQMLNQCKKGQSVRPGEFWTAVATAVDDTIYEHLAQKAPHDSHEFFLFLLESLHESTAQDVEMRIVRPPPQTAQEHLIHGALTAWQREFSKEYSPFVDLFYGLLHYKTTCKTCGNLSHRWESFNSLKGSVPPGGLTAEQPTLAQMLAKESEPESIEGYHCDKCPERTVAERICKIWRLPQTLIFVLKRFTPDGRKIHTRMAPLADGVADFTPFFSEESPERAGVLTYSLRAIVDHHGGANGGHYTAQARLEDGRWNLYDDEGVMEMPPGRAPHFGDSTYMLFLERGVVPPTVAAEA
jgi:ubiquitin C-terminal hydrolase